MEKIDWDEQIVKMQIILEEMKEINKGMFKKDDNISIQQTPKQTGE